MEPLEILLVAGLIYVAYTSGALAPLGIGTPNLQGLSSQFNPLPPGTSGPQPQPLSPPSPVLAAPVGFSVPSPPSQEYQSNTASTALGVGAAIASAPKVLGAIGVAANVVPIVGQVVSAVAAIGAALLAAHQARIKQARDENSAMNLGVQGVDKEMSVINQAYNAGQISAQDTINLLSQTMNHYWQLTAPHIQPGRNGCGASPSSTGSAACPPWPSSGNGCSGSIGAACCVGCYDLAGGPNPAVLQAFDGGDGHTSFYFGVEGAIIAVQHGGHIQTCMQGVVASKYGGANRNGYRLSWAQVGS